MIQPISNTGFAGRVYLGGREYSAIKTLAGNIQEIYSPKTQDAVKECLAGLSKHTAKVMPQNKELAILFKQRGGLAEGSASKITIAIKDLTAKENSDLFTVSKKLQGKNSRGDKLQETIDGVFAKAAEKIDGLFSQEKISKNGAETIGQNINLTA